MNQTIRSRIEQIKRGEIPEGYEKTPFGIFPCDWEKSTLKKLGEFAKGKGIPGEKMKNEGIPCVGYGDIYMKYNYHFNQAKSFIDRTTADESIQVGRNTLLFTGTGETAEEIGKCVCYTGPDDIYVGGDIIIFNSVEVSPVFIAYQQYLPFAIKQKAGFGQGYSVVHIYKSDLEKLYCAYPKSKAEQEKIAEILQEQDRLIELKEKLIEEKKKQKQYLMEVLLTGKVRLPGFTDEWEKFHLCELCSIRTGRLDANAAVENGRYPFFTCSREELRINKYSFNGEAILLAGNGDVGHTKYYSGKFDAYQRTYVLMDFKINPKLIKCYIDMAMPTIVQKELQGGAMPYIKLSTLEKVSFFAPNDFNEQEAIIKDIELFAVDLELLQKELEEQKRKKQSLMQLLLTGIIRVKF